ncbi:MAG: DUF2617 family protein [Phycisphaeraceae bacterium]|nr:DUF2617 family protein [Phycisphaeraceae bacterium]
MDAPTRQISLQTYQTLLYRRALHPELFALKARRSVRHGLYDLEIWLMPGSHLLRLTHKGFCASELVTFQENNLPTDGAVTSFPCAGERDFEHRFDAEGVRYLTSVQTETLADNLYSATFGELLETAEENDALVHRWTDADGGRGLSMVDVQRYSKEVHAQCYHLVPQGGFVLRTQTIFEHR